MLFSIGGPQPGAKRFLNYLVIIVVLGAVVWFLNAMSNVEKQIEQVAIEKKISEMNASLALTLYSYVAQGKLDDLQHFHLENPFLFLAINYQLPRDYNGTILDDKDIKASGWYYNSSSLQVIYQPMTEIKRQRFQLLFEYHDVNKNGKFEHAEDVINGFKLGKFLKK